VEPVGKSLSAQSFSIVIDEAVNAFDLRTDYG
jgi:hypothetical protein